MDRAAVWHPTATPGQNPTALDGLKCGPGQSAGTVKLNAAPGALTTSWYLIFTSYLYFSSPSMRYITHITYVNYVKVCVVIFALILFF